LVIAANTNIFSKPKQTFMKKLFVFAAILFCMGGNAQKGINKLVLAADLGIPTGDFGELCKIGGGPMAKFLFGVTPAGDITATTGVSFYPVKFESIGFGGYDGLKATFRVVPILVGYRHNFNGLFVEPQLGMGIYAVTAKYQGASDSDSETAFTWAAGMGYAKNNLETGLRYQSGEKDGSVAQFVIHIGYLLQLKSRK
jgi:hypothetical protein